MASCDDLITNEDLAAYKKDAEYLGLTVESPNHSELTPNGQLKRTISGMNADVDDAVRNAGGIDIGDYSSDPLITNAYEYAVFDRSGTPSNWKVKAGVSLPYQIDSTTYPTPQTDPNLQAFQGLTKAQADLTYDAHNTLNYFISDTSLIEGMSLRVEDRADGIFDVVLASTVTPNTFDIVQCTGVASLALVLRKNGVLNPLQLGAHGDGVNDDFSVMEFLFNSVYKNANSTQGLEASALNQVSIYSPSGKVYLCSQPLFLGSETTNDDWIFNLKINFNGAMIRGYSATATDHTLTIAKASKLKNDSMVIIGETCKGLKLNTIEHSSLGDLSASSKVGTGLTLRGFLYNTNINTLRIGGTTGFASGGVAPTAPALDADYTGEVLLYAFRGARIVEINGLYITGMGQPVLWKGDPSLDPADALSEGVNIRNLDWELNNNNTLASFENVKRFTIDNLWNEGTAQVGVDSVLFFINTQHMSVTNVKQGSRWHKIHLQNTKHTYLRDCDGGSVILTGSNDKLIMDNCNEVLNSQREFLKNLDATPPYYTDLTNFDMRNVGITSISSGLEINTLANVRSVDQIENRLVLDPSRQTNGTVLRFTAPALQLEVSPLGYPVGETTVTSSGGLQTLTYNLDTTLLTANNVKNVKATLIFAVKHQKKVGTGDITGCGALANGQYVNGSEDIAIYQGDWLICAQRLVLDDTTTNIEVIFNDSVALTTNDVLELGGAVVYYGHDILIPQ